MEGIKEKRIFESAASDVSLVKLEVALSLMCPHRKDVKLYLRFSEHLIIFESDLLICHSHS